MTDHDENFLAKVFDSVTDPFAIYDRQFRILKTNQALLILFKLPAEKVIGRYCYNFFYKEELGSTSIEMRTFLDVGEICLMRLQKGARVFPRRRNWKRKLSLILA